MKKMPHLIVLAMALTACSTFDPHVGMSLSEWRSQCRTLTLTGGQLVAADGDVEVYTCDSNTLFGFENGTLKQVATPRPTGAEVIANQQGSTAMMFMGLELMRQSTAQ